MDEQPFLEKVDAVIAATEEAIRECRKLRQMITEAEHPSLPGFTPVKPVVDPIYFDNIDSDIRPVRSVTLGPDAA